MQIAKKLINTMNSANTKNIHFNISFSKINHLKNNLTVNEIRNLNSNINKFLNKK